LFVFASTHLQQEHRVI